MPGELLRRGLAEREARERQQRHREADLQEPLLTMRQELQPEQAGHEEDEHAELEEPEDHPCGVGAGERVDERPANCVLIPAGAFPSSSNSFSLPE